MPSLDEIARVQTALSDADVTWLSALTSAWQVPADLAFSDLVLWLIDAESKGFWAAAQIRPTTGPTTLLEDIAGSFVPATRGLVLDRAVKTDAVLTETRDEVSAEFIPVRPRGEIIGVIERRSAGESGRMTSPLEHAYQDAAAILFPMIQRGQFPVVGHDWPPSDPPRVGDGFIRTDRNGHVMYASPNAMSAYRRLGLKSDLAGVDLGEVTTRLVDRRPTDRAPRSLFVSQVPIEARLENSLAALQAQVIALHSDLGPGGSVVLLRDVTELRSRDRELVTKEATIREIHHRVKNNLQTVAALLRLQARRSDLPAARSALEDAERRVASIALVHETLSGSLGDFVAFDSVVDDLLRTVIDLESVETCRPVKTSRIGQFGTLPGELATPLAMVLTELLQNAVHHGVANAGERTADEHLAPLIVTVAANRIRNRVRLRVGDNGPGLPPDFDAASSLGLSIVTTLVESDLGGKLSFDSSTRGTTVTVAFELS